MVEVPSFRAEHDAGLMSEVRRGEAAFLLKVARAGALVGGKLPVRAVLPAGWGPDDLFLERRELLTASWGPGRPIAIRDDRKELGCVGPCLMVSPDLKPVPELTVVDDLPDELSLLISAAVVPELADAVERGELYMSLACRFGGFDYVLRDPDGAVRVVPRTGETAGMTQYLAAFGGAGRHEGMTIGRALRYLTVTVDRLVHQRNIADRPKSLATPMTEAVAAWWTGRAEARGPGPVGKPSSKLAAEIFAYMTTE